jgi:trk system potassium uptake protein TrkA
MNMIVVGCGRVGAGLASGLHAKGHRVTVIDQWAQSFANLPPAFRGRTIEADVLEQDVLRRAGISQTRGLAAVTNSDSVNAVVCHVARELYHVPSVVARNYDPRWRSLQEAFGLQVVSSASWGARRIEQLLHEPGLHAVLSLGSGEVEVYELTVEVAWHGSRLGELLPEEHFRAVALTRAGRAILPDRELWLEAGDIVHVSATPEGMDALRRRLKGSGES